MSWGCNIQHKELGNFICQMVTRLSVVIISYANIKSLCSTLETNILYASYISIKICYKIKLFFIWLFERKLLPPIIPTPFFILWKKMGEWKYFFHINYRQANFLRPFMIILIIFAYVLLSLGKNGKQVKEVV